MEYMQLSMDDYIQSKNEIKQELGGIVKSFVRIGWQEPINTMDTTPLQNLPEQNMA